MVFAPIADSRDRSRKGIPDNAHVPGLTRGINHRTPQATVVVFSRISLLQLRT